MKTCNKCGENKPAYQFYRNSNKCKECTKASVRANRREKIEYYREYEKKRANRPDRVAARKEYAKTEAGREAARLAKAKWANRNPIKRKAHITLGNAIRDGKLIPLPCEVCFNTHDIHAHHDDYSKPLDVRWLCAKCHKELHKDEDFQYAEGQ